MASGHEPLSSYQLINWWNMQKFSAVRYFMLARHLELWARFADNNAPARAEWAGSLKRMKSSCEQLSLQLSAKFIDESMLPLFENNVLPDKAKFLERVDILVGRIEDEMSLHLFLHIPSEKAAFYDSVEPLFGREVSDNFPSAITDIEEAGKCLLWEEVQHAYST
jgi:hypothetical protein